MKHDVEVIVIGAGPAGLTAARELQKHSIEYTLVERDKVPGLKKPCGGFIPTRALEEFRVGSVEKEHLVHSVRMRFKTDNVVRIDFDSPAGANVRREHLASALMRSLPATSLRLGTRVAKTETTDEECRTILEDEEGRETLSSELIIDASGANPVTQRFTEVRARPTNSQLGYALQYHMKADAQLEGVNDFFYGSEYSPRGYAWCFPCNDIAVVGTGGLVSRVRASDRKVEDYLKYLIEEVEPTRSELEGAEIIRRESALMPLAGIVTPSYGRRLLLAGDAACHCSPISGEGIYYSMIGGQEAARTAAYCVKKSDFTSGCLSRYERDWKKRMGSDLKWGLYLQKRFTGSGSGSGNLRGGLLSSEDSYRVIAEMLVGIRSVRSAILKVAPSYLRSKIGL
jgi:geranylgeranyl reductase family protein